MKMTNYPDSVRIIEMGARDGLQNEANVPTTAKVALINALSQSGLTHIEAGAFVSAKRIPQMADSADVLQQITRSPDICYSALTPNLQGYQAARKANVDQVAVFTSSSEGFCQSNIHCSIAESLARFAPVIEQAKADGVPVRGYLSCVVECPYDGPTAPTQVARVARSLYELGCDEISLGDTIGRGTPASITPMLEAVLNQIPRQKVAVHFHNTWGLALVNVHQALSMGISTIDASVAGLGGCPYAPGASGNVATEDVLYLCEGLGIKTGVDIEAIAKAGWEICRHLNKAPQSNVSLALLGKSN
ncbi:hydroxymethylglutaryl-CoA lyase [Photobacterium jeanii]|uniref:hydroxymethylglutaryl-CoA lyase n=1 Tax=Photobacterium jeanii TaxID=858640 RepID=A0A178K8U4_9GAMM|nr:hydroxymethylglutaryl-CoA lyase [Photobacterium jeanii]OAN13154.1 hydroxymethylglutaryl-CoA lyase [Photobacterium jeanii]PST89306.1 hydroxymethylglutaryl-CoA lyase [Photobacterium jeanii]